MKRKFKKSDKHTETSDDEISNKADFNSLSVRTLRKYRRFYKLSISSNMNKNLLANEIKQHFSNIELHSERTIITYFIHFIKQHDEVDSEDKAA